MEIMIHAIGDAYNQERTSDDGKRMQVESRTIEFGNSHIGGGMQIRADCIETRGREKSVQRYAYIDLTADDVRRIVREAVRRNVIDVPGLPELAEASRLLSTAHAALDAAFKSPSGG
jgi:hypothetical protein